MVLSKIRKILSKVNKSETAFEIFIPEKDAFGHYSTNLALRLAKERKSDPVKMAHELVSEIINHTPAGFLEKIEVVPPGFINLWLSAIALHRELQKIFSQEKNYGRAKKTRSGRIQVEFVSANPTGPLTLASGRGGFFGDALANVLEFTGHEVEREYYVNDAGNQILTLGKSLLAAAGLMEPDDYFYKGGYIKDWAKSHKSVLKKHQTDPMQVGQLAAKDFLKAIKEVLRSKARIHFDRFTSESDQIHKKGYLDKTLNLFYRKKLAYEKDGAVWLKTTKFGDDKDRVLLTSDGFPTYFLADAGHYLETKERGFHSKINILGPDHYGYVARIQAAAEIVGLKHSEVLITQAVRLTRGGKKVKMSKRRGEFVTFRELIEEVHPDAARFLFLMTSLDSHLDFDIEAAKQNSMKNPVYYVQYAYVRAASILKKVESGERRVIRKARGNDFSLLNTPEDLRLIMKLIQFPETLEDAAADYGVHRLAKYAFETARTFHNFYEKERVVGEEQKVALARLALVRATEIVLKNVFDLIGISAPKRM